jgi:hypothetical protein
MNSNDQKLVDSLLNFRKALDGVIRAVEIKKVSAAEGIRSIDYMLTLLRGLLEVKQELKEISAPIINMMVDARNIMNAMKVKEN